MGTIEVPDDAYYGAQTQRAVENFPISGITISKSMIQALAIIKRSAAAVNHDLGILDEERKKAIIQAADEIIDEAKKIMLTNLTGEFSNRSLSTLGKY